MKKYKIKMGVLELIQDSQDSWLKNFVNTNYNTILNLDRTEDGHLIYNRWIKFPESWFIEVEDDV